MLTTDAAGASSGAAFTTQPVVAVRDASGNLVLTDNSTVVTMSVDGVATTVGTVTATAVNGVATFSNVGLSGLANDYTLTFASGSLVEATQSITLGAGTATQLAITTPAASASSGAAFTTQPVVAVRDASGNVVLTDNATVVTMTVDGVASTLGTVTATAVNGVATFSAVGLSGPAGDYTLTFGADALTDATQAITLVAGAPSVLVLTMPAGGAASGTAFTTQPIVEVRDAFGNAVLTDNATIVTMTVDGAASTVGTATATAANGIATFTNVGLSGVIGDYTLTFASGSLDVATQSITLGAGAATQLVLANVVAGAATDTPFSTQPILQIQDAAGNVITTDNSTLVTMTVSPGATVFGPDTATAVGGIVSFSGTGLSGPDAEYTITFSAGSLTSAEQQIIMVSPALRMAFADRAPALRAPIRSTIVARAGSIPHARAVYNLTPRTPPAS